MDQKPPNIVLPITAALIGLVGIVWAVIYYGSQQIEVKLPVITPVATTTVIDIPEPIIEPATTTASTSSPQAATTTSTTTKNLPPEAGGF